MNAPIDFTAIESRTELLDRLNRVHDGSLIVPSEYLEIVAVRR